MELTHLPEIPEEMLRLIEPATKGGAHIYAQHNGHVLGQVHKAYLMSHHINPMRDTYRLYIESDSGSGEHRYNKEEADNIYLSINL